MIPSSSGLHTPKTNSTKKIELKLGTGSRVDEATGEWKEDCNTPFVSSYGKQQDPPV